MQENQTPQQPSSTNSVPNRNPNLTSSRICPRCSNNTDQRYCYACGYDLDQVFESPFAYNPPFWSQTPAVPTASNPPTQPMSQQQPIIEQPPFIQQQQPTMPNQPIQQPCYPPQQSQQQPYYPSQPMGNNSAPYPQQNYPYQQMPSYQQPINYQQTNYPLQPVPQKKNSYWWIFLIAGVVGIPLIIGIIFAFSAVYNTAKNSIPYMDENPYAYNYPYEENKNSDDSFPGGISQREFSQITKGMTYAHVSKIIGGDGALTSSGDTPQGKAYYIFTWQGEYDHNAYVHITFIEDVVSDIVDDGLMD